VNTNISTLGSRIYYIMVLALDYDVLS
jgi:hypothetical protein